VSNEQGYKQKEQAEPHAREEELNYVPELNRAAVHRRIIAWPMLNS
jgi:hypothetical protein